MRPAIFLDRDGVIIENREDYVRSWNDVSILPGVLESLAMAARSRYAIVIVTNQSAIGRGLISLDRANEIHQRLEKEIMTAGGRIDGIYLCPHAPDTGCNCRKPAPGMILQAANELSLDLPRSVIIGDALTDLSAGKAAGIPHRILVGTGRGYDQYQQWKSADISPFDFFDTLSIALSHLLSE
jgi:D-glycero-D-manno-heptose 1,7-bisphosphate phosphatase